MSANHPQRKRALLVILDGFGLDDAREHNAIAAARTPNLDQLFNAHPSAALEASGRAVGLPPGQMGNSEVGHLTLGAGALVRQYLVAIDDAIADGSFFENGVLTAAMERAREGEGIIHLIGLVSAGGVHSHIDHLLALIDLAARHGVRPLVHMITDGRDTPPRSARADIEKVEQALERAGGAIATLGGRYYAMDRDARWERTERAWRALVLNEGERAGSAMEALERAYEAGIDDEFIPPTVLPGAEPMGGGSRAIFFNFRKDRARQLTAALALEHFTHFNRGSRFRPVDLTCMTNYDPDFALPYAFVQERPDTTLAETLANAGLRQFHCAETEKYAHVTYFFNGGRGEPYPGEVHELVPSPRVATYDQAPEMSAAKVTDRVIAALEERFDFVLVNYANGDMVGHTAVREAAIAAVETLDREVGRLVEAALARGYAIVITADHGNCERLIDPKTGKPHTQHTTNPVPCCVIDQRPWLLHDGGLADVAPTVLHLMGLDKPAVMSGHSLLLEPDSETLKSTEAA